MLYQISRLPEDTTSLIMYCDSAGIEYIGLNMLRRRFDVNKDYYVTVDTEKDLLKAKSNANVTPLIGKKWVLYVDADKIDAKALEKQGKDVYDSCLIIYHTTRYGVFAKLKESKFAKYLGRYCVALYGGAVSDRDIKLIMKHYDVQLDEHVVKTLIAKYRKAPQAICDLCSMVKSGYSVENDKDIISAVGLGDINVASFVLNLMAVNPKSVRSRRTVMKRVLSYLENLAEGMPYSSIQNFILDTLDGMIDIKLAIISGKMTILDSEPPESYSDKRVARFKRLLRYQYTLRDDISLEQLLFYRGLYHKNLANPKQAILDWVLLIFEKAGLRDGVEPIVQHLDTSVPVGATFNLDNYNAYGDLSMTKVRSAVPVVKSVGAGSKAIADIVTAGSQKEPSLFDILESFGEDDESEELSEGVEVEDDTSDDGDASDNTPSLLDMLSSFG